MAKKWIQKADFFHKSVSSSKNSLPSYKRWGRRRPSFNTAVVALQNSAHPAPFFRLKLKTLDMLQQGNGKGKSDVKEKLLLPPLVQQLHPRRSKIL